MAYEYKEQNGEHPDFEWFVKFLRRQSDKACDSVYLIAAVRQTTESNKRRDIYTKEISERRSMMMNNIFDKKTQLV